MFLDFYRLREQPFGVTPDPRYLYFSPGHREALASLFYGIETGRGFLALIAKPGMGKTTLLLQLLERMKSSVRSVFLFQTQCNSRELLRYLLEGLGLDSCEGDFIRMHTQLNQFLLREAQAGRRVVLFIDEAQNLSDSVLETVRLLSNFEATDRKLLQIVLAGQPELAQRLLRPDLTQLRQRITAVALLRPLPAEEILHYVNHRLQVAGYEGPELFTSGALALITACSQGIPRNINNICFSAMSLGCATGRKMIGRQTVREAIVDLSLDSYVEQSTPANAASLNPARPATSRFSDLSFWSNWLKGWRFRTALLKGWRFRTALLKGWHFRTALLLVVLMTGLAYFGERRSGGESHSPSPGAEASAVQRDAHDGLPAQASDSGNFTFAHVVGPNDTLAKLCLRFAGGYNEAVLAEIKKLNQDLRDPNHIQVGQRIRLPRHPPKERNATGNSKSVGIRDRSN